MCRVRSRLQHSSDSTDWQSESDTADPHSPGPGIRSEEVKEKLVRTFRELHRSSWPCSTDLDQSLVALTFRTELHPDPETPPRWPDGKIGVIILEITSNEELKRNRMIDEDGIPMIDLPAPFGDEILKLAESLGADQVIIE